MIKTKKFKRIIGTVTAAVLSLSAVGFSSEMFKDVDIRYEITARADEISYREGFWNETTHSVEYTTKKVTNPIVLEDTKTAWGDGNWYIVPADGVTISNRITVTGIANLILADGATLNAPNGITVLYNDTLNIYAQSEGNTAGKLIAGAGADDNDNAVRNAAIGGTHHEAYGSISIYGGTINATSGKRAGAAIGAGDNPYTNAKAIKIYGGTVNATGTDYAAGIGGGCGSEGDKREYNTGTVTIYGGEVTATAGNGGIGRNYYPTGIGVASYRVKNESVKIYGGTVIAIGGSDNAGGIGKRDADGDAVTLGSIAVGENVKLSYSTDGVKYTEYDSTDYTNRPRYMKAAPHTPTSGHIPYTVIDQAPLHLPQLLR